jgi:D-glycero-D-manno-heptose 1,7-bisphosphate phosphatase
MKLVIIDRDGVLDAQGDDALAAPETWQPLPGALEAVARLNQAGWRVVLASDQSGLGRGLFEVSALNALHTLLHRALASVGARLDAIFYCPHGPDDGCHCRMPLAGLFEQIGERYGIELSQVPAVAARPEHVQAGAAAGCPVHRIGPADAAPDLAGVPHHAHLAAFADHLLSAPARAS